jgi:hypothetical protein
MKDFTMNYGAKVLVMNSPETANAFTPELADRLQDLLRVRIVFFILFILVEMG